MFWRRKLTTAPTPAMPANDAAAPVETWSDFAAPEPVSDTTPPDFEPHEFAGVYPMLRGSKFDALVDAIRRDGQIEPVVIFDGRILDGRNRYAACKALGIAPKLRVFEGTRDEAVRFVQSTNSARRHLTTTDRALAAARLSQFAGVTIRDAAVRQSIGLATLKRAKAILTSGDDTLIQAVEDGAMSISAAYSKLTGSTEPKADDAMQRLVREMRALLAAGHEFADDTRADLAALAGELAAVTAPRSRLKVVR